jgi:hypothetical protein
MIGVPKERSKLSQEIIAVLVGGVLGFAGSYGLFALQARRQDEAIRIQLFMLMRSLERSLIPRRDNDATWIGGYDTRLNRMLDRAFSKEAALAIPNDGRNQLYDSLSGVEEAIASIKFVLEKVAGTEPSQRRKDEMKAAASYACDQLGRARKILGDGVKLASPIGEHEPDPQD